MVLKKLPWGDSGWASTQGRTDIRGLRDHFYVWVELNGLDQTCACVSSFLTMNQSCSVLKASVHWPEVRCDGSQKKDTQEFLHFCPFFHVTFNAHSLYQC